MASPALQRDEGEAVPTQRGPWGLEAGGEVRVIQTLDELAPLVAEGRIGPEARVFPLAALPLRLGDVAELEPLFRQMSPAPVTPAGASGPEESLPEFALLKPLDDMNTDAFQALEISARRRRRRWAVPAVALLLGVGAGALLARAPREHGGLPQQAPPVPAAAVPAPRTAPPVVVAKPSAAPVPAARPAPVVVAKRSAAPAAPPPASTAVPVARPVPRPTASVKVAAAPAPAPAAPPRIDVRSSRPIRPAPVEGRDRARSYEQLVAEGNRLTAQGMGPQAVVALERATALRPDGVDALTSLGYAWLRRGDNSQAAASFQRVLKAESDHRLALYGLGDAFRLQGNRRLAADVYRRYLARYPRTHEAQTARRRLEELQHAPAGARSSK